jgi:TP901 family phage tail tape measure protein
MAKRFTVEAIFKGIDKISAPMSRMHQRLNRFTSSVGYGFSALASKASSIISPLKKIGFVAAGVATGYSAAMISAISDGAKFEKSLVSAAVKFPGEITKGSKAFQLLEEAARKVGSTTEFSASQAADALNFLAMAGFSAESAISVLPKVVDLATAANVDLATATDIASDSLGAFGLMSKDAEKISSNLSRVNDLFARTTTRSNTTMQALFETIKDGAPVAITAGASMEAFAAMAGRLADAGIKGTQAGTTLKNIFLSLAAPSATASKLFKKLGVDISKSNGDMRNITDIIDDLSRSLDGLGTTQKSAILEGIFGRIPIAGVNVLLKTGSQNLKDFTNEIENSSGASRRMSTIMRNTIIGRMQSLKSAIESVKISIFSLNEGPLAKAIESFTNLVRVNEEVIAKNVGGFLAKILNNLAKIPSEFDKNKESIMNFLSAVQNTFTTINNIINTVSRASSKISSFFGLKSKTEFSVANDSNYMPYEFSQLNPNSKSGVIDRSASIVSPTERISNIIENKINKEEIEITIKDETGKAEISNKPRKSNVTIIKTGEM